MADSVSTSAPRVRNVCTPSVIRSVYLVPSMHDSARGRWTRTTDGARCCRARDGRSLPAWLTLLTSALFAMIALPVSASPSGPLS